MTIWKKTISAVTSAALLASLFVTAIAPAAFGASTSAGGGVIYPDYAASAAFTLTFAEDAVDQFGNGSFEVRAHDSTADATRADFVTTVAPTVTRNLGLGTASAGFNAAGNLVVNLAGTDDTKIDSFTIGGLKATAEANAASGALIFYVIVDGIGLSQSLVTVTGTNSSAINTPGQTSFTYALDIPALAGAVDFQPTGTACTGAALTAGKVTVAASGVSPAETFDAAALTGAGTIVKATDFTAAKPVGTAVSQSVCASVFPSPVTVGDAVLAFNEEEDYDAFQAGTNSKNPDDVVAQLGWFDKLLLSGDTVTFTLATAGVLFSPDNDLTDDIYAGVWNGDYCEDYSSGDPAHFISSITLAPDRKSITTTLDLDTLAFDCIDFGARVDIAASVPNGTAIEVGVTTSRAGVVVLDSPVTTGYVGFLAAGSTAAPTIFIGQNDQSTGMVTIKESAAGVINDNGLLEVCLQTNESWSVGRYFWAVVTSGDLKLNVAGLPASQAKMTLNGNCLEVLPYTASTVASTIQIRDGTSAAPAAELSTNGPKVNVPNWMIPGQTYVRVYNDGVPIADNVVIAVRAYTGTPTATTSGQLMVARGMLNQATGSITFTEGAPNQFGSSWYLSLCIVPPSSSFQGAHMWSNPVGANAPVVTTNSTVSGLIAQYDPSSGDRCIYLSTTDSGLSGLGSITISNLKLDVKGDAPLGPVFVRLYTGDRYYPNGGFALANGGTSASSLVATVSPATVVDQAPLSLSNATALGVVTGGTFSNTTKVQSKGKYVTWRFVGGSTLANKTVQIWVATKAANGTWSAFTNLTARKANAAGTAYFHWRSSTTQWISVRAYFPGDTTTASNWSPARQARWR